MGAPGAVDPFDSLSVHFGHTNAPGWLSGCMEIRQFGQVGSAQLGVGRARRPERRERRDGIFIPASMFAASGAQLPWRGCHGERGS